MINLTLPYCRNRYSNMECVLWPSDYNWINMNESTILLVAMEKCIVRLPILYFWFDQFHLQYFDFCIQHPALFRETHYIIKIIINFQPITEWLNLSNHFYQWSWCNKATSNLNYSKFPIELKDCPVHVSLTSSN